MKIYSNKLILLTIVVCGIGCNSQGIKIGKAYEFGDVPVPITEIERKDDPFSNLKVEMADLPGHDDLIFDAGKGVGFASGMDGWIWKLDLKTGKASQWIQPPMNPAGMSYSNRNKDKIVFCASRLGGDSYEETQRVGLYEVEIATKTIRPLLLDLPKTEQEDFEKIYSVSERKTFSLSQLNSSNSRPFSLCNDLAVSEDGNRIYISEPFERKDAAMGSGAVPEAIGLYPHGKLWFYDRKKGTISLALSGFTFVDGILLEENRSEESVVITETTKFRILRAYLSGKNQGKFEVLFENLPGLADGLERDEQGRIWTGIIKKRSGLINFVHRNPWLKPFLLSIPQSILPVSKKTGILVLDKDGKRALYYSMHDGSKVRDISVAVPFERRAYFPSFDKSSRGLFSLSYEDLGI
ncbi:SMP-30/gluconolactonase/LRE family protein [Leptospira idonii]|uniref:SMP-30/gluconolaconase/LRE-like region n=1 Tax=Leptospira idonii TaxID=1193500 RepID=A0A4R9M2P8_9LEPT|nr:SMP-30/gluconolactonase/LRE family protein [Leptospira idonii]TGN21064.1 SMP-30/gluconolaconase/LRE-like region [Leptospira idonii]